MTTTRTPLANKEAIVSAVAEKTGMKKVDAENAYEAVLAVIASNLVEGRDVRLSGIGTLKVKMSSGREARNPRTGETFKVEPRREVRFGVSKELKTSVAGSGEG